MPRFRTFACCWIGCVLLCVGVGGLFAEEIRSSERLLPNTTQGFFAISSVEKLDEHWNKTQLGHLMADPVMEPFTKDVRRQFEDRWSGVHERLGLTLKDMAGVPGGDVGIGLIAPESGKAALAIVMDVTGKLTEANELLERVTRTQLKRGAKRSELKIEGCPDVVIQFDLPEPEEEKEAKKSNLRDSADKPSAEEDSDEADLDGDVSEAPAPVESAGGPLKKDATAGLPSSVGRNTGENTAGQASSGTQTPEIRLFQQAAGDGLENDKAGDDDSAETTSEILTEDAAADEPAAVEKSDTKEADAGLVVEKSSARQAFYCLTGNLLVVADDLEVLKGILGRKTGDVDDSLADLKPFQIVMERCAMDYGETAPQMRWFLSPLGYAEAARAATPADRRRKGKTILEVMRNQGVGAIQGLGGLADFSSEGYELIHRTVVYAPKPYEKSMKMLVLPNRSEFTPQDWVPRDIATYTTLYFDILNAFDNFGPLFNEFIAPGAKGAWEEAKESLKLGPHGPQVDLREDLIVHLGQRVSMLTDYQLPITTTSERLLFAIEVTDAEAVAKALGKLLKDDPTVKRREKAGHVIWEIVGEEVQTPKMEFEFGGVPPVAPAHPPKKKDDPWEDEEEEERKPLLPHAAVTVCKGHLFIASHIDFLLKVIAPEKEPSLLRDDVDYQLVTAEIEKFEPKEKCFRFFSRTDEEYRPTYELIRQNKMPQGETMLARMLNVLFGEGKKGMPRAQKIDGSQLPEYQVVRRYLGPAGMQISSEKDGWFLKGFTLSKEAE